MLDAAEQSLAAAICDHEPPEFARICAKIIDCEFPGGLLPNDDQVDTAREVVLRPKKDGSYGLAGRLTGECGAKLAAILDAFGKPEPATSLDQDSLVDDPFTVSATEAELQRDLRSPGQRKHDALQAACTALLRAGLPQSGGTPASVVVTIALADLIGEGRSGGTTADGQTLSPETVGRLLNEAEILPTVVDPTGVVMWQGREQRLATPAQTKVLYARDGGCSFPGCDEPPSHCERHHVIPWAKGGRTDVGNLTLLCSYHHRNFLHRGWTVTMNNGLPHWTAPPWVDPTQTPTVHPRIVLTARYLKRRRT